MRHVIKLSLAALWAFVALSVFINKPAVAYSGGPDPGNTGAPGEFTCSSCHSGGALGGNLSIQGVPATYAAGQEYTITVTLVQAGRVRFGFQATVLGASGNSAGTFVLTDTDRTQLRNSTATGSNRDYIQHTATGTALVSNATGSWSFKWRAPSTGAGGVTFYVAGNAANGDFTSFGDSIYTIQASSAAPPATRAIRAVGSNIQAGFSGIVFVEFDALGNENLFGFSVNFNQSNLQFVSATLGVGVPSGTTLLTNQLQAQNGRVGFAVSLPFGVNIAAGTRQLLQMTFLVPPTAFQGPTTLNFGDSPIPREFVSAEGTSIPNSAVSFISGNVTITPPVLVRNVRAIGSTVQNGSSGAVVIEIDTVGNENGLAFSLTFDPTRLAFLSASLGPGATGATLNVNSSQVGAGRVGIGFALPSNQALLSGTRQVLNVTFSTTLTASSGPVLIGFGDVPVIRELVDTAAGTLPVTFSGATVLIEPAYEGDTTPRPFGNGTVSLADWVQAGRFAVGLDVVASGSEFQRADCAPRNTLGNGVLTLADWVQAGRYAAILDPATPAGGPTTPTSGLDAELSDGHAAIAVKARIEKRSIMLVTSSNATVGEVGVVVWIAAKGTENAISFSLSFDAQQWEFVGAHNNRDWPATTLILNDSQKKSGRIGVALALPPGQGAPSGWRSLVDIRLRPLQEKPPRSPEMFFVDDNPVRREVIDVSGNSLSAEWLEFRRRYR